jgi:TetR/AcrR family transcriptional regulator, transcriptional repressor for nem operon
VARVSQDKAQENRERVVQAAARLYREKGFDGVGIADVMKSVGLTHGGFYAQFPSKDHLMAEACAHSADTLNKWWTELVQQAPRKNLSALAASYLSQEHRDDPGSGCVVAGLGIDTSRQGTLVRSAFTAGVRRMLDVVMQVIPGRPAKVRRREALAGFSAMVGAVVLARAVNDEALSDEILAAARAHIAEMDRELGRAS